MRRATAARLSVRSSPAFPRTVSDFERHAAVLQPMFVDQRRTIFGEIIGVLANPGETVRSLSQAKQELEKAREVRAVDRRI